MHAKIRPGHERITSLQARARAGEITVPSEMAYDVGAHLNFPDVTIDNPKNLTLTRIRLKVSKTDPFRNGVDVYLGHTRDQLCLIEVILAFLAV